MSKILRLLNISENTSLKNSLPLVAGMMDNNVTTKLQAVKPNRHSLAIFIPKIHGATNPMSTTGIKQRHIYSLLPIQSGSNASYGGLIRPNTIAFMVNKSRRLVAFVETRRPFLMGGKTTKLQGGHNRA
jgi:hypothetical protein